MPDVFFLDLLMERRAARADAMACIAIAVSDEDGQTLTSVQDLSNIGHMPR